MSLPTVPYTLFETLANFTMLIVGVFVSCGAFYFIGRNDENKRLAVERLLNERKKRLKNILEHQGLEDLEREDVEGI